MLCIMPSSSFVLSDGESDADEWNLRVKPDPLESLCRKSAFSKREIQQMYRGFKQVTYHIISFQSLFLSPDLLMRGTCIIRTSYHRNNLSSPHEHLQDCPSGVVREEKFKAIYSQFFPRGSDTHQYAHYLYSAFDRKQAGILTFTVRLSPFSLFSNYHSLFLVFFPHEDMMKESFWTLKEYYFLLLPGKTSLIHVFLPKILVSFLILLLGNETPSLTDSSFSLGLDIITDCIHQDLVLGLSSLIRGSIQEKLIWTFHLYDVDGDGVLSKDEIFRIVSSVYDLLGKRCVTTSCAATATASGGSGCSCSNSASAGSTVREEHHREIEKRRADALFHQLDLNGDGVITITEFMDSCLRVSCITLTAERNE